MLLALLSLLLGMVLGQRFKVLALIPALALMLVVALAAGMVQSETHGMMALTVTGSLVSLQVGYLAGLGIRHLLAVLRASRLRAASFANSIRSAH